MRACSASMAAQTKCSRKSSRAHFDRASRSYRRHVNATSWIAATFAIPEGYRRRVRLAWCLHLYPRTGMPVIHRYEEISHELGTGQRKLESGQRRGEEAVGQAH